MGDKGDGMTIPLAIALVAWLLALKAYYMQRMATKHWKASSKRFEQIAEEALKLTQDVMNDSAKRPRN